MYRSPRSVWVAFLELEVLPPAGEPLTTGGYITAVACARDAGVAEARVRRYLRKAGYAVVLVESMRRLREVDSASLRTKKFFTRFKRRKRLRGRVRTTSAYTFPLDSEGEKEAEE